jgi:hypothetical protein
MQYMLLINSEEANYASFTEEQMGQLMADYGAFSAELEASGSYLASHRLRPTDTATTVRVREREVLTTDGPFAETKEQFGGYYLIDVANLDEAIQWAAKIPTAKYGSVEVRPVWLMEEE